MTKFVFKPTLSDDELNKLETETSVQAPKVFQPGKYEDLKILEFVHNKTERNPDGTASGDPTWLVFKAKLGGIDSRSINTYVLVPTASELYKKPGMKNPGMMYIKLREFLRSLGLPVDKENMGRAINGLLTEPEALVGMQTSVTIGYPGAHLKYDVDTKTYSIVSKKGLPVDEGNSYTDRDAAKAAAAELGVEVVDFPEVQRFNPRDSKKEDASW